MQDKKIKFGVTYKENLNISIDNARIFAGKIGDECIICTVDVETYLNCEIVGIGNDENNNQNVSFSTSIDGISRGLVEVTFYEITDYNILFANFSKGDLYITLIKSNL